MKAYLTEIIKTIIYWFLFFVVGRIIFLVVYSNLLPDVSLWEIMLVFPNAFKLDLSTACWLSAPFLLFISLQYAIGWKGWNVIKMVLMLVILVITSMILFGEIGVYDEWRVKLSHKALLYLRNPKEIIDTVDIGLLVILLIGFAIYVSVFQLLYCKVVAKPAVQPQKYSAIKSPIMFILLAFLIFCGMRGGLKGVPISQSQSFFSQHAILNDAAVNTQWNFIFNYVHFKTLDKSNPFQEMPTCEANDVLKEIYNTPQDTNIQVISINRPNVIFVLLESWSGDCVATLGGRDSITPYFAQLEKEGLMFTGFYANGHRSQQAMSSVMSSFPPMQGHDITDIFSLYKYLGSMPKMFKNMGYNTSYYFAGDLRYGNIKAFILWNEFDKIMEDKDFPMEYPRGQLSIPDEYLFAESYKDLHTMQQPFFSFLFTASSHAPYDEPKKVPQLTWDVDDLPYLNSVKYSDYELYQYIQQCKTQPWYDSTLFVIVSDHSHATYMNHYVNSAEYMHVPMLWMGGALDSAYVGKICSRICSQIDIYPTLAAQMGVSDCDAYRGKNIFNPYSKEFAYYETNMGFGWVVPQGNIIYDGINKRLSSTTIQDSNLLNIELRNGKAYLQTLYDFFLQ